MTDERTLFIPVILGTTRQGRMSEHVARLVFEELGKRKGVESELIDIRELSIPSDDAGSGIKDAGFSETCMRADAFVLVAPEYNTSAWPPRVLWRGARRASLVGWLPVASEGARGPAHRDARAGAGDDLLGRELFVGAKRLRRVGQAARRGLHPPARQVLQGADLDGESPPPRSRAGRRRRGMTGAFASTHAVN